MVTVKKHNNLELKLIVSEPHYRYTLKIIREKMPSRRYDNSLRVWFIPICLLPLLVRFFTNYEIDIIIEDEANVMYNGYIKFKNMQNKIRNAKKISKKSCDYIQFTGNEKLLDYQIIGAMFAYVSLIRVKGAGIFDPVGLGKTAQAIAIAERMLKNIDKHNINIVIILCRASAKYNFRDEILKFTGKNSIIIDGTKVVRNKKYEEARRVKENYVIINYDLLIPDFKKIINIIDGRKTLVIFDEVQATKNSRAKRSVLSHIIKSKSNYALSLTASPLENSVVDYWGIFHNILPELYNGSYTNFIKHFTEIDFFGNPVKKKNTRLLKSMARPYIIRRLKQDVLPQLPTITYVNKFIELSQKHKKIYKDEIKRIKKEFENSDSPAKALQIISYARQLVLNTGGVGIEPDISSKTDEIIEILNNLDEKDKVIIFSEFIYPAKRLYDVLSKNYRVVSLIGGNVKKQIRYDTIKKFNNDSKIQILIATNIIKESVNIESANYVINYDIPYNPEIVIQRIGRMDRLTQQNKKLFVINLITKDTIEEKIYSKIVKPKLSIRRDIVDDYKKEKRIKIHNIGEFL